MISEEVKNKIKALYIENKYDELIEFSEKFTLPEERPSGLINLIGISYFSKKNSTDNMFIRLNFLKKPT